MQVSALELWMLFTFLLFIHFNNAQILTFFASLPEIYPNPDERASVGVYIGIFNTLTLSSALSIYTTRTLYINILNTQINISKNIHNIETCKKKAK